MDATKRALVMLAQFGGVLHQLSRTQSSFAPAVGAAVSRVNYLDAIGPEDRQVIQRSLHSVEILSFLGTRLGTYAMAIAESNRLGIYEHALWFRQTFGRLANDLVWREVERATGSDLQVLDRLIQEIEFEAKSGCEDAG